MALGGLLCLFGVVLACKIRDGNRALAQADVPAPVATEKAEPVPAPKETSEPPRLPMLPGATALTAPEATPEVLPAADGPVAPVGKEIRPVAGATPPVPEKGSDSRPIVIPAAATVPSPDVPPPPSAAAPAPPAPPVPGPEAAVVPPPVSPVSPPPVPAAADPKVINVGARNVPAEAALTAPPAPVGATPPARAGEGSEAIQPLPTLRARATVKSKATLPLTGTYVVTLDEGKMVSLPKAILNQLGNCPTVLVSPGSDRCLWLTNQAHLDRLQAKLDRSPARESDVRVFKRLYYAQTVKVPVKDGRVALSARLAEFASLGREVVLVGIDDHFEVWDAARWRRYMQARKAKPAVEE
jgi:MraZ protein